MTDKLTREVAADPRPPAATLSGGRSQAARRPGVPRALPLGSGILILVILALVAASC